MFYDFWGRRRLKKIDFLYDFLLTRMADSAVSLEQATKEALEAYKFIKDNAKEID